MFSLRASMAEHLSSEQKVAGSSPVESTNFAQRANVSLPTKRTENFGVFIDGVIWQELQMKTNQAFWTYVLQIQFNSHLRHVISFD